MFIYTFAIHIVCIFSPFAKKERKQLVIICCSCFTVTLANVWCYIYWELIVRLHHHRVQWNYRQEKKKRRKNQHWNIMYRTLVQRSCCVHNTLNRFAYAKRKKKQTQTNANTLFKIEFRIYFYHSLQIGWVRSDHEKRHERCPKATEPIKKDSCQMKLIQQLNG